MGSYMALAKRERAQEVNVHSLENMTSTRSSFCLYIALIGCVVVRKLDLFPPFVFHVIIHTRRILAYSPENLACKNISSDMLHIILVHVRWYFTIISSRSRERERTMFPVTFSYGGFIMAARLAISLGGAKDSSAQFVARRLFGTLSIIDEKSNLATYYSRFLKSRVHNVDIRSERL